MPTGMRRASFLIFSIWGVLNLLFFASPTFSLPNTPTGPVPGRYIVKLKSAVQADRVRMALGDDVLTPLIAPSAKLSAKSTNTGEWERYYVFQDQTKSLSQDDIQNQIGRDNIEWIEPDYYLEFFDYPSDSLFPNQWYLYNHGQQYLGIDRNDGYNNDSLVVKQGEAGFDVGLSPLYQSPQPEATKVVVAVIDTGVDPTHPELQGQFWRNLDEIPRNNIDDDHNGYIDDTLGYDVSGNRFTLFNPIGDNDPTDTVGHGTHIAGIIAAKADGKGVVGIAPNAAIMPVKIYPNGFSSVGAAGIVYAVMNGANVISISWGSPFISGVLRDALLFARSHNVFVAIAAGNTGTNDRYFPAGYDSSFVVGATNSDGQVTEFSTFGSHIDIVAPGLDILSLRAAKTDMYAEALEPKVRIIDSLYYLSDGTSMATPMVAGAAAVLRAIQPNLTVQETEEALLSGATDIIDPYGKGESFPGKDTISGYGELNIASAVSLMLSPGLFLVSPQTAQRYTADFTVKAASLRGYAGGWHLFRSLGYANDSFVEIASGVSVPTDSVLFTQSGTTEQGPMTFRLVDNFGRSSDANCSFVTARKLEISSPNSGDEVQYNIPIRGSAYGPGFDSVTLYYQRGVQPQVRLRRSTGEFFDSLLFPWTVSGADTGVFKLSLNGYYGAEKVTDTVSVHVTSAFAEGWPQSFTDQGAISPIAADLDGDNIKEVILGTAKGLYVWGQGPFGTFLLPHFPLFVGDSDMQGIPAVYDVDKDGIKDIICTSKTGLHVFKKDGTYVKGFPKACYTGQIPYGFGYPIPRVTQLNPDEDSVIMFLNRRGEVCAYRFNGTPYFYSLKGLFASLDPRISDYSSYGGFTWPFATTADLNGDGALEVIASYTSGALPYTGISILEGRTGQPAWGMDSALVLSQPAIDGTVLADLNGDGLPEIIVATTDSSGVPHIWVKTKGTQNLAGWPVALPAAKEWAATYPTVGDLDLDGHPEVILSYFDFDVASVYAFRWDGTPYISKPGRPAGELYYIEGTSGTPIVADVVGDAHREVIVRSGYVLPGTGNEKLHVIDYQGNAAPGYPIITPTNMISVFSSQYAPLVDDLDGDGIVDIALVGDGYTLFVWHGQASSQNGTNVGRLFFDNLNSGILPTTSSTQTTARLNEGGK